MGPYCKFCDRRCFVTIPKECPEHLVKIYPIGRSLIATCERGQNYEKETYGVCYADICNFIERDKLIDHLRAKSRELCPDYPDIKKDLGPLEHLWAITSSLEGTNLANNDMHDFANFLRSMLNLSPKEAIDLYHKHKKLKENANA